MKFDYFKMMSKVEFEMKEDSDIEMDECKHDDYVVCCDGDYYGAGLFFLSGLRRKAA